MNFGSLDVKVFRIFAAATALALLIFLPQTGLAKGRSGAVYVLTNQTAGNSVAVFHRDANGMLKFAGKFASGGKGAGTGADPLGSQGAVILSEDHTRLFAVNAGSDSISVFTVAGDHLTLVQTIASGGTMPVSLATQQDLLYVLNAGGTPNISGFRIDPSTNHLVPLPGSSQNLPGGSGAAPAEVAFGEDESVLVVTEKATNLIDTFVLDDDGVAQPGVSSLSSGKTPFGFAIDADNVAVVSEAFGGAPGASALSSYEVDEDGNVEAITPSLGDTQGAACWVVVTRNGRFAYTSNTASNTISSYQISEDGELTLHDITAATGKVPVDMALTHNSRFLYTRNAGDGTVNGYRVHGDGSLTLITSAGGLPNGAQGIAAR